MSRPLSRNVASLLLALSVLVTLPGCSEPQAPLDSAAASPEPSAMRAPSASPAAIDILGDRVEGERVARRVGCTGCHGRDGRGTELWERPGEYKLYAANLTEQRHRYNDAGIERLLRHGQTHDGHRPVGMPIFMFERLSDREIIDIIAWLRALPAVSNPTLKKSWFSDDVRRQLQDGTFAEDDDRPTPGMDAPAAPPEAALALGEHLAMTSCVECHGRELTGWGSEDNTPSLIVAKAYTQAAFARLMKTGIAADGKETKTAFMSDVSRERFAVLRDDEIAALKVYLDQR